MSSKHDRQKCSIAAYPTFLNGRYGNERRTIGAFLSQLQTNCKRPPPAVWRVKGAGIFLISSRHSYLYCLPAFPVLIVANCTCISIKSLNHSVSKLTVPYPAVYYPIYALPIAYCFHGFCFNVPWLTLAQFSLLSLFTYTNISALEFFVPHFY